jgi:hypothetical protein
VLVAKASSRDGPQREGAQALITREIAEAAGRVQAYQKLTITSLKHQIREPEVGGHWLRLHPARKSFHGHWLLRRSIWCLLTVGLVGRLVSPVTIKETTQHDQHPFGSSCSHSDGGCVGAGWTCQRGWRGHGA